MEEMLGNVSNYFAVRDVNEFSYDGGTWYKEGDRVKILGSIFSWDEVVIKTVYDNGKILVKKGTEETSLWVRDIDVLGAKKTGDIFFIREIKQFSIDLENWFGTGQCCSVYTDDALYINADIVNIFSDGKILFRHKGNDIMLPYSKIAKIWDSGENIIYLLQDKRLKMMSLSIS